jgi:phosphatidate cytidylyltransferase
VSEPLQLFISAVLVLFLLGGLCIAIASALTAGKHRLWTLYGLEIIQVAAILIPALLGPPVGDVVFVLLAILCVRELASCFRAAGSSTPIALTQAVFCVGVGSASIYFITRESVAWFVFGYALIEINDTMAWAVGSAVGKHKLWPRVSPNKTWEGLIGGVASSVLLALALGFLVPDWSVSMRLGAGLWMALAGTAGDLVASHWKRRSGLRHYSELFPMQGGVFDLYDSLVLAAPLWWLYLSVMQGRV